MSTKHLEQSLTQYSQAEEIANALSHGIGALLSVAGLTLLLVLAISADNPTRITSFAIYGTSLIVLFSASTLYHALTSAKAKRIFKLIDHCAIYLLIAGTYTPLMLITLQGYVLLAIIWLLALIGIVFKIICKDQYKAVSLLTYLGMGFISLTVIKQLNQALPPSGMLLLASGGAIYTLGVLFYVNKNIPYNHAIWHLFVMLAAGCHFAMMLLYV